MTEATFEIENHVGDSTLPYTDSKKQILKNTGLESVEYLSEKNKEQNRTLPNIDFRKPENFVKFGSAERYYKDSIQRIYKTYPFDGSRKEVSEWLNSSSYLDIFVYENLYPKNVGFITLNKWIKDWDFSNSLPELQFQDIDFNGYPNADDTYINPMHVIEMSDSQANVIDDIRSGNLKFDANKGITIEYWIKLDTREEVETETSLSKEIDFISLYSKGRMNVAGNPENVIFRSGIRYDSGEWKMTFNIDKPESSYLEAGQNNNIATIEKPEEWFHVAVSVGPSLTKVYLNGSLEATLSYTEISLPEIKILHGNIGRSLQLNNNGEFEKGSVFGFSMDELRLWNIERTELDIKRNWNRNIGGGTNTDDSNIDLGIYYKFNEGIYGNPDYDQYILDYSGRQTDTIISNYSAEVRCNDPTLTPLEKENKDPVIYPEHPDVISLESEYEKIGKHYDNKNSSKFQNMIPSWITEEELASGSDVSSKLSQIMSSYLDTLFLQIQDIPNIVSISSGGDNYNDKKTEATVLRKLENKGFIVPELFADSTLLEKLENYSDENFLENNIDDVKSMIYKNILNNSDSILKSKGTEKSIRNMLRCMGVGEELIKIRNYPINYELPAYNNSLYTSETKRRYADFCSSELNRESTFFSFAMPNNYHSEHGVSYGVITGSDSTTDLDRTSFTLECEVYFPKKRAGREILLESNNVISASIAGLSSIHNPGTTPPYGESDDTTQDLNAAGNIKVRFIKDSINSTSGHFQLEYPSSIDPLTNIPSFSHITSSNFEVYDNERWNISVRLGDSSEYSDFLTGSSDDSYSISFSGYNFNSSDLSNEFTITKDIDKNAAIQSLTVSRRIFVGADVNNHTGSMSVTDSDALISSVRYWVSWLSDDTIKLHALCPESVGTNAIDNRYYYDSGISGPSISGIQINEMDLLALHWDFSKISEVNNSLYSHDLSGEHYTSNDYLNEKVSKRYSGMFHTPNGNLGIEEATKVKQISSVKPNSIGYIRDVELINTEKKEYDVFKINPDDIGHKITLEKSYASVLDDEILKYISGSSYVASLIGRPVNKYRVKYKEVDFLKRKIFALFNPSNSPNSNPDIEKFLEYYKWIDESINKLLRQVLPASFSDENIALNVIESHLLERSKYQYKIRNFRTEARSNTSLLVAPLRITTERTDIKNPASLETPAARYIEFSDNYGNKKVYINFADVEWYDEDGNSYIHTAQEIHNMIEDGDNVYFDFS